jgi:hypothetical protein
MGLGKDFWIGLLIGGAIVFAFLSWHLARV